ncbi:C1 family peptidase [Pseudooceanicola marinus]|uniref:C1 family peptidase n=1 Tax=Pseudooceanicola marinus TaxID=396013 RepID=UPI001CD79149|nr:C1 family peptidase [Pseudooceanicola marinus]MCA1337929.1 C1 family peptidase [Pseudooceanicola marinus]
MKLHIVKDLRSFLGPVRDQGRRPTCLSFAASAAHEHARGAFEPLSVEWLYYHTAQLAGTGPDDGTTLPDTRRALHQIGQPDEPAWPYRSQLTDRGSWVAPTIGSPLFRCGSNKCDPVMVQVQTQLDQSQPVVLALYVSSTFTASGNWLCADGEIILPEDGEPIDRGRGHGVVAVGYGRFGEETVLLLRNSWGTGWGRDGHAWVSESYLARRLFGGFNICEGDGDVLQSNAGGRYASTRVG